MREREKTVLRPVYTIYIHMYIHMYVVSVKTLFAVLSHIVQTVLYVQLVFSHLTIKFNTCYEDL